MEPEITVSESSTQARAGASEAARTVSVIDRLFPRPRNFDVRLPDGTLLPGATSTPSFALALKHPGALRRMVTMPIELSMGEAYIYGDFEIEGDIFSIFSLIDTSLTRSFTVGELVALVRSVRALPKSGPPRPAGRGAARLRGTLHSRERDLAAIRYHYDAGNEFFALWLDRRMQYSCAYFPTGSEDLDVAQEHKLEHICRKLRLRPGDRLLDIGCGWGGLAEFAADQFGVEVVGVNLSERQVEYAQARSGDRVDIRLLDYRDLEDEPFDKIVSVGMYEHIGRSQLPVYFGHVYRLLKPGGLFLNHGISSRPPEPNTSSGVQAPANESRWRKFIRRRIVGDDMFAQRYVFPDSQLVPVSETNLGAERAGFEVRDVENLREHYARTARHWVSRLEARRQEAIELSNEVTYRTWRLYMAASAYGFEAGRICVNQTLLSRRADGRPNLPLTRADIYHDVSPAPEPDASQSATGSK